MASKDRRAALIASSQFNGIDFIEIVATAQTMLTVHFFNEVDVAGTLTATPTITGGETISNVAVDPIAPGDWGFDDGHQTLTLRVGAPGDFSSYLLTLNSSILDPFYSQAPFSFKAACPSDLDCRPASIVCPPLQGDSTPIDYLAKDFLSFRQALLDFSALRYPSWQERSEADFGVMFLETLSALADDFSYMQDRIAAESTLGTATQRRSVVRHARLVDYEPQPLLGATVTLQFDVGPNCDAIPFGTPVSAREPAGGRIVYETGSSLAARLLNAGTGALLAAPPNDAVSALWNRGQIQPYWYDDSQLCLPSGATSMSVLGHGFAFQACQALLIETAAPDPADPPIRQIVHLLPANDPAGLWAVESCDPLFLREPGPAPGPILTCDESPPPSSASPALMPTAVTLIRWQSSDKLQIARDLRCTLVVGNLVNATQGVTFGGESFTVTVSGPTAPAGDFAPALTVVRTGAATGAGPAPPMHQYTLAQTPLAWLPVAGCSDRGIGSGAGLPFNTPSQPEIVLTSIDAAGQTEVWSWGSTLLSAGQFDQAFTLDDARFSRIVRNSDQSEQYDYDGDSASTIRFGDGTFGMNPLEGTVFSVTYRVAAAARGNVASDSITELDPNLPIDLLAVTNPLPATGGTDPQALDSVRGLAPAAFRAVQFRAVLPSDYIAAAQTQSWVQRAGCVFRWTGSWLTVFTTPDPIESETVTIEERLGLVQLLNRYRLAGYESYVPDPNYLSVDLIIEVCAQATAFRGDVESSLAQALSATGFFAPGNFSFGQPLERSRLEAAIQALPGLDGVLCIEVRVRGRSLLFQPMADRVTVGVDQIIRCDNDPSRPERGAIKLVVLGGK